MKKKNVIFIVIVAIIISLGLGCFVGIEYNKNNKVLIKKNDEEKLDKKIDKKILTLEDEELNDLYQKWYGSGNDGCLGPAYELFEDKNDIIGMIKMVIAQDDNLTVSYCSELDELFINSLDACGISQPIADLFMNDRGSVDQTDDKLISILKGQKTRSITGKKLRQELKNMFGIDNLNDYPDIYIYSLYHYNKKNDKYYEYNCYNCGGTCGGYGPYNISGTKLNDKIQMVVKTKSFIDDEMPEAIIYDFKWNKETKTYILDNLEKKYIEIDE